MHLMQMQACWVHALTLAQVAAPGVPAGRAGDACVTDWVLPSTHQTEQHRTLCAPLPGVVHTDTGVLSVASCVRGGNRMGVWGHVAMVFACEHAATSRSGECCRDAQANIHFHAGKLLLHSVKGCMAAAATSQVEHGASHIPAQHTAHGMHALVTPPPGLCAPAAVCASHQQRPPAHHTRWRGPAARCTPSRRQPPAQTPLCTSSSSHDSTGHGGHE